MIQKKIHIYFLDLDITIAITAAQDAIINKGSEFVPNICSLAFSIDPTILNVLSASAFIRLISFCIENFSYETKSVVCEIWSLDGTSSGFLTIFAFSTMSFSAFEHFFNSYSSSCRSWYACRCSIENLSLFIAVLQFSASSMSRGLSAWKKSSSIWLL